MPGEEQRATSGDLSAGPLAAAVADARRWAEAGDLTGARSALESALAGAEGTLGPFHPDLVPAMVDLATIARELGNLTEAQRQLGRAHRILIAGLGAEHVRTLTVAARLVGVNQALGDPTGALDRLLADAGGQVWGDDHPAVREARARLGDAWLPPGTSHPSPAEAPAAAQLVDQANRVAAAEGSAGRPASTGGADVPIIDLDGGAGSAWADAGEWSDPSGWSGGGWSDAGATVAREAPYAPVPGAPGVFGRQEGPAAPTVGGVVRPPRTAPAGDPAYGAGAAPVYTPAQYDSSGWAAPTAAEETEPQVGAQAWAPPGWQGPAGGSAWEDESESGRRRLASALVTIGIILALIGGVIFAVKLLDSRGPAATGAQPETSPTPPAATTGAPSKAPPTKATPTKPAATSVASGPSVGVAPAKLKLTDEGASITITWRDPSDGTVPFIVAGARRGDESHPMQSIPAGRTRSTIYGLNTSFEYCFTVAAVYSIDVVAQSDQVCTHRLSTATPP